MREFVSIAAEAVRLLSGERRADLAEARRALDDALLAWPGEVADRWWKWIVETSRGLNLAARVIDATPHEIAELLRHGVAAVTLADSKSGALCVLTAANRYQFRVFSLPATAADANGRWVTQRKFAEALKESAPTDGRRRWVVLDAAVDDMPHVPAGRGLGGHEHVGPLARLREFLRPERSDLWIVVVHALVIGLLTLATPIAVEALVNTVAFGTLLQPLIVLSIILLTFLAFAAALKFLQRFVVELIQRRLLARVAARLAWQLPRVRLDCNPGYSPELMNRFFDVVTMQKIVAQLAFDGLTVVLTLGLGMIVLAFYHPWLLAFDGVLVTLLFLNIFVMGRGAVRTSIDESYKKYALAGWLEDIARCPLIFKSSGAAEFALNRTDRLTTDYLVAREAHYRVLMRQIVTGLTLEAIASAVLLGLGGFLVIQGQMTLGQLVAAELIVTMIVAAVAKLDKQFEGFYDLLTSIDKLGHVFDLQVETASGAMHVASTGAAGVAIKHVSFAFAEGTPVLSDVSLEIAPGEVVALIGSEGCGKSTLLDLLFRLHEPTAGRLSFDDLDLSDLRPDVLRHNVALVRGVEVLEATLAENVHLDRTEISTADVRATLRRVGLDDGNLDTMLGRDGRPFSDSQVRRLMLARAIVARPRLLLIDGTLDFFADEVAVELVRELQRTRLDCSVIVVTNRQAIAEACDRDVRPFITSR